MSRHLDTKIRCKPPNHSACREWRLLYFNVGFYKNLFYGLFSHCVMCGCRRSSSLTNGNSLIDLYGQTVYISELWTTLRELSNRSHAVQVGVNSTCSSTASVLTSAKHESHLWVDKSNHIFVAESIFAPIAKFWHRAHDAESRYATCRCCTCSQDTAKPDTKRFLRYSICSTAQQLSAYFWGVLLVTTELHVAHEIIARFAVYGNPFILLCHPSWYSLGLQDSCGVWRNSILALFETGQRYVHCSTFIHSPE